MPNAPADSLHRQLQRGTEAGPYPEAEVIYREAGYVHARNHAARTLQASPSSQFSGGLALECLWDCEESTRRLGCESVEVAIPEAHARIQALLHDPEDEVRDAASKRLAAITASTPAAPNPSQQHDLVPPS